MRQRGNMTLWSSTAAQTATGGFTKGTWNACRVVIDSRRVKPGDLFVAIKGDTFDGHEFVADALAKGAVAAVVSTLPLQVPETSLLVVKDSLQALRDLALYARARTEATIIGVTGSVGKTGTKDALRCALSANGDTYATEGNLNNHIGLPLSLANLPENAVYGVFELGMNHAGEIEQLTTMLKPDISLITTVESVHSEFFDSVEAIADAKAEIFEGMKAGGVAVLNVDNAYFERLKNHACAKDIRVVSFGTDKAADYVLTQCTMNQEGSTIVANLKGTPVQYTTCTIGKHWGLSTLAALAVCEAAGADVAKSASALAHFREPVGRGRLSLVKFKHGEITLIDDSYNASPASMNAAIEKLQALKEMDAPPRRTVAVLGDMLELGEQAETLHVGLVPALVNNQIDLVFAAGNFMRRMYEALPETMRGDYAPTAAMLAPKVVNALRDRDLVLVKGSHGSHMHEVINAIHHSAGKEPSDAV